MGTHRTAPQDLRAAAVDELVDDVETVAWVVSACDYAAAGAPLSPAKRAVLRRAATRQEVERAVATMHLWNGTADDRATALSDADPLIAEQARLVDAAFAGTIRLVDAKRLNAVMELAVAIADEPQLVRKLVDRGVSPRNLHGLGSCRHVTRTTPRPRGAGRPRARRTAASSTRSSSSDDPGEPGSSGGQDPPPPPLFTAAARRGTCTPFARHLTGEARGQRWPRVTRDTRLLWGPSWPRQTTARTLRGQPARRPGARGGVAGGHHATKAAA